MSATTADPFTRSVTLVLDLEGADTDNIATDPDGGLTRFGISSKQHPEVDVAGLTRDAALAWYRQNVWDAHRCGEMAWPVCLVVFDEAVNQGNVQALQHALGVREDGVVGPVTLGAAAARSPLELAARTLADRAMRYTEVRADLWKANGPGWMYRLARIALAAGEA